jgi:hypothetical protein
MRKDEEDATAGLSLVQQRAGALHCELRDQRSADNRAVGKFYSEMFTLLGGGSGRLLLALQGEISARDRWADPRPLVLVV